jgi:hypothetical protein
MKSLSLPFQMLVFFLLICCVFMSEAPAQKNKKVTGSADNCEIISLKLDSIANTFKKVTEIKSFLIIITGSPKNVNSRYNSNRISDAIKYLTKFHEISSEKIIFGIGSSSGKLGYLKFYVRGEFVGEIKTIRKAKLCFGMGETF